MRHLSPRHVCVCGGLQRSPSDGPGPQGGGGATPTVSPPLVPLPDTLVTPVPPPPAAPLSFNPFGESSSSGSRSSLQLHAYSAAIRATHLGYHALLMTFVEGLFHGGWVDFNPFVALAPPTSMAGGNTKAGHLPSWCRDYTTFATCWAAFVRSAGSDPAVASAMQALMTIVTGEGS